MRGHLFPLYTSASPSSVIKPLTAYLYNPIKRYSQSSSGEHAHEIIEERAPSTAKEFKKMAEEKLREAEQGVASQTAEKGFDGTEEATLGDSNPQSVKKRYEEHEDGAGYRKRRGDPQGVKAFSNKS